MKIIRTAGKTQVKMSKSEWQAIGKKAGWITAEMEYNQMNFVDSRQIQHTLEVIPRQKFEYLNQDIIPNVNNRMEQGDYATAATVLRTGIGSLENLIHNYELLAQWLEAAAQNTNP